MQDGKVFENKVLKETTEVSADLDLGFDVQCVDMSGDSGE